MKRGKDPADTIIMVDIITIGRGRHTWALKTPRWVLSVLKHHLKEMAWRGSGGQGRRGWLSPAAHLLHERRKQSPCLSPGGIQTRLETKMPPWKTPDSLVPTLPFSPTLQNRSNASPLGNKHLQSSLQKQGRLGCVCACSV